MFDRLLKYCRDRWQRGSTLPEYDYPYLQAQRYRHLETDATIPISDDETRDAIRCNLCGHLFEKSDVATAVDHVAAHSSDRDGEVDVFEERQKYGHVDPLTEQQPGIDITETESETDSKSETADT
jgi:hypothetical protein